MTPAKPKTRKPTTSRTPDAHARAALDYLRRIIRELRDAATAVEKTLGISSAQLFVLQTLATVPGASLNDIAARTLTHQSSVSVVVKKLIERGFVSRRRAATDKRRSELSLTARGRSLLKRGPRLPQQRLIDAALRLSARERRDLSRCLGELVRHMGVARRPPSMLFDDPKRRSRERPVPRRLIILRRVAGRARAPANE